MCAPPHAPEVGGSKVPKTARDARTSEGGSSEPSHGSSCCCCSATCCAEVYKHCCACPSLHQAASLVVFAACFGGVIALVATGTLTAFCDRLSELGGWAHVIFGALFCYTGLPFGYGYSVVLIASGYVLGWPAIVTSEVGTVFAVALGVFVSRHLFRAAVQRKLDTLPDKWSRPLKVLQDDVSKSPMGFIFVDVLVRLSDNLTLGINNSLSGAMTDIPIPLATVSGLLAAQYSIVFGVYTGTMLRHASDDNTPVNGTDAGSGEEESFHTRPIGIAFQIVAGVLLANVLGLLARRRLKRVMRHPPETGPNAPMDSPTPPCANTKEAPGPGANAKEVPRRRAAWWPWRRTSSPLLSVTPIVAVSEPSDRASGLSSV